MRMRRLILLMLTALVVGGCRIEPPLYLRMSVVTQVNIVTEVEVDAMWQKDWQALWQFPWNEATMGPLGYTEPTRMRMHVYTHGPDGKPVSHIQHSFDGCSTELDVFVGKHNLLFHNVDSEANLFTAEDELSDVYSYTRTISSGLRTSHPVYTEQQKMAGYETKGDSEEEDEDEPVALAPDGLFAEYIPDLRITDNPEDYILKDGKYILLIKGNLTPASYIYLIQVRLLNNGGRVVGSAGGAAITGMAAGVNMLSKMAMENTVSVPMDVYMDSEKDMMGARVMTFGNPGCNPYDPDSVRQMPEQDHNLVINVTYSNGSYRNIRIDITDQVRALPLGGVISLDVDVNDFPPDDKPGTGGGFNALVDDWSEETGETTIVN